MTLRSPQPCAIHDPHPACQYDKASRRILPLDTLRNPRAALIPALQTWELFPSHPPLRRVREDEDDACALYWHWYATSHVHYAERANTHACCFYRTSASQKPHSVYFASCSIYSRWMSFQNFWRKKAYNAFLGSLCCFKWKSEFVSLIMILWCCIFILFFLQRLYTVYGSVSEFIFVPALCMQPFFMKNGLIFLTSCYCFFVFVFKSVFHCECTCIIPMLNTFIMKKKKTRVMIWEFERKILFVCVCVFLWKFECENSEETLSDKKKMIHDGYYTHG